MPFCTISSKKKGFALFEVLIALALFGLLAAISVPSLGKQAERHKLRSESQALHRDLQRLILQSSYAGKQINLQLTAQSYKAYFPADMQELFSKNLHKLVRIDLGHNTSNEIKLYPSQVTTPATIKLLGADSSCQITLSLRGRVRLEC